MVAALKSEWVAAFKSEYPAGFIGIRSNPAQEALRTHLLNAHTSVEKVGKIAETAGVSTLVLNHIVPGNARAEELVPAQQDFAGQLIIGEDLLQLGVRRARH